MIPFLALWGCAAVSGWLAGDVFAEAIGGEGQDMRLAYSLAGAAVPPVAALMAAYCIINSIKNGG